LLTYFLDGVYIAIIIKEICVVGNGNLGAANCGRSKQNSTNWWNC